MKRIAKSAYQTIRESACLPAGRNENIRRTRNQIKSKSDILII